MGFGSDFDIVKDMGSFDNTFHDVGVDWSVGILCEIWNSQNLEIRFGLGELSILNVINIKII